MFWDALTGGLTVLTYWETYAAALIYIVIALGPLALIGFAMEKAKGSAAFLGCLTMFLMPILQTFAIIVFVLTLSPIILGVKSDAAWSLPWILTLQAPWSMAKMVGLLFVVAIVLAFIPMLRQWQSIYIAVLGSLALGFVLAIIEKASPGYVSNQVALWPGFWFFFGLLVVGGLMAWIGIILAAFIASLFEIAAESVGQLLLFPAVAVLGFIPTFMYGSYLGAQIRGIA